MRKGVFSTALVLTMMALGGAVCWAMGLNTAGLGAIGREIYTGS